MAELIPVKEPPPESKLPTTPLVRENGRPKSTLNLKAPRNGVQKQEEKAVAEIPDTAEKKSVDPEQLKAAWREFAELRKHQIAEYNLLKKEFILEGALVTIILANPIEEPLLQNIRVQLIAHLRDRLNNNSISVISLMQESEAKKIAYTDKEKFDLLAEKNPALRELKERFGLDSDY